MRIASQGTLKNYVTFAVNFLKEHPTRSLTLHTLPFVPPSKDSVDSASSSESRTTPSNRQASASSIPQLISVVELVKRTFLSLLSPLLDGSDASSGEKVDRWVEQARERGLWQYNETGILEDIEHEFVFQPQDKKAGEETDEAEQALEKLKHILGGKTGPKMIHTPYMKITLSTVPIPSLASRKEVTCQSIILPPRVKKSKNKGRQARRQKLKQALCRKTDESNTISAQTNITTPLSALAAVSEDSSAEGYAAGTKRTSSQTDGEKGVVGGKKRRKVLA
ncbi:hypothetical protein [Phaffia rhodozyma]|uniref:Uncharacterized protein n=1 Tax=Phaffia rhodozyma TaxID=264483 RepID=A0A0F7SY66_PHARH|nr:hypothetical protein [Phaffia rhodozyma]